MNRFRFLSLIALACILLCCPGCKPESKPEFRFRASHIVNENHAWYQAFAFFAEQIEARTDGRVVVENYHSEQLAKEIEAIRLIQAGVIDMTCTGSTLSNWTEIMVFCELPFLLRDSVDMRMLLQSEIGKRMEEEMIHEVGLRPIGIFPRGPRHLTSKRPIKHPDELNGLILRVPNVPSFVTAWEALGAKPTPMAFSEVFTSLQQGTIEAQENPFALIHNAGFAEVQDYINLTAHVVSWTYPVIGEKQYQSLPDDLRQIFDACAHDMVAFHNAQFQKSERTVQEALQENGMTLIEVDKDAFASTCKDAIYQSLSPDMQQVYHQILELKKSRP